MGEVEGRKDGRVEVVRQQRWKAWKWKWNWKQAAAFGRKTGKSVPKARGEEERREKESSVFLIALH